MGTQAETAFSPGWVGFVARRAAQYALDFALSVGIGFLVGLVTGLVAIPLTQWGMVPPMTLIWGPVIGFAVAALLADGFVQVWVPLVRGGVTPGMWVLGLRVTTVRGGAPTVRDYLVRWFLFTVDGLLLGTVAAVSIAVTRRRQRVGDLLARTVVVRVS